MKNHIHIGATTAIVTFGMVMIVGTVWRIAAYNMIEKNPESQLAKAMLMGY